MLCRATDTLVAPSLFYSPQKRRKTQVQIDFARRKNNFEWYFMLKVLIKDWKLSTSCFMSTYSLKGGVLYLVFCPRARSKTFLQCFALEQRESVLKTEGLLTFYFFMSILWGFFSKSGNAIVASNWELLTAHSNQEARKVGRIVMNSKL